jgi:hypothetical protein
VSLRQILVAGQLPQRTVPIRPPRAGADPYEVTVRALPGDEWDALVQLHPPTPEQAAEGWEWNIATFRPALLAACVDSPADQADPLTEQEWAELLIVMSVGERDQLYGAAFDVNANRWPTADVGKGSG